ncbi:MAG: Rne/Rng family ribonuclease [Roseinatronobacter sp.]
MAQKMLIDATHAEETRVVVVDGNKVEEFDFETASRRQLAGNIYLAKVTRVEPSLQAAFVDYGGNRHGFLAFNEIHPDYYQIPAADRAALLEEERALACEQDEDAPARAEKSGTRKPRRSSNRRKPAAQAEGVEANDAVETREISSMDVVDLDEGDDGLIDGTLTDASFAITEQAAAAEGDTQTDNDPVTEVEPAPYADMSTDAEEAYRAADHAAETDDQIEAVSDNDTTEDFQVRRKPRARRYKIQEVIRVRQIMLVQVVKEERGNKGAALTTYLSLAGRYCVLMPNTARGGGISRKITNAADRQKLKAIASEIDVPDGAGLIIRTAGANRTKPEIKRDYEYLFRLWEQIRELTLKSIAPCPIYEEGSLIKRAIRDLYNKDIDEVLVEGEAGFRVAKDFMKMIMPTHAKNVKLYAEQMPLFARYQVESTLSAMFNPVVQLPSGGYIVIGITEALVAIDINSGRATREGSIEETALRTNLEAAAEIARQLRLRDLAGLIVIDFIDMEERRNNAAVEKMLKDKLKSDRARIQVGRISGFGLLEMSRQRLRPGMLEATTQPCPHCHGTGLIRSDDTMGLTILRQVEEEGTRGRSKEVLVKAPAGVINFLFNMKREHIAQIEGRYGMAVRLEADPNMVSPDFTIEKFKVATRVAAPVLPSPVVSLDASYMTDDIEEDEVEADAVEATDAEAATDVPAPEKSDDQPRKKRRRRRRRRGGKENGAEGGAANASDSDGDEDGDDRDEGDDGDSADVPESAREEAPVADVTVVTDAEAQAEAEAPAKKPKRTRKPRAKTAEAAEPVADDATPAAPKRSRSRRKPKAEEAAPEGVTEPAAIAEEGATDDVASVESPPVAEPVLTDAAPLVANEAPQPEAMPEPEATSTSEAEATNVPEAAPELDAPAEPAVVAAEAVDSAAVTVTSETPNAPAAPSGPKRKGWWSR